MNHADDFRKEIQEELQDALKDVKLGEDMDRDENRRLHLLAMMFKEAVKASVLADEETLAKIVPDPGCVNAALMDMMDKWPDFMDAHDGRMEDLDKIRSVAPYRMPPNISEEGAMFVGAAIIQCVGGMASMVEDRHIEIHTTAGSISNLRVKDIRVLERIRSALQTGLDYFAPCEQDMPKKQREGYHGLLEAAYELLARMNLLAEGFALGLQFYQMKNMEQAQSRVTNRIKEMRFPEHWTQEERNAVLNELNL